MKKFFYNNHKKIDLLSSAIFLYSILVCFFILLFNFLNNECLYAVTVLCLPIFFIRYKYIQWVNRFLHRIFRFDR